MKQGSGRCGCLGGEKPCRAWISVLSTGHSVQRAKSARGKSMPSPPVNRHVSETLVTRTSQNMELKWNVDALKNGDPFFTL